MQMTVLVVSLVLMAAITLAFAWAARAASAEAEAAPLADLGAVETRRRVLVLALLAVGVVVTLASLWHWPHAVSAGPSATVNVTGSQWYWKIDRTEVPLGEAVVFNIQTSDVTHGAGIMNAAGRILVQAQAMPGYVNRFEYTFDEPGTYRVACLEYCGVAHHGMINEFTVVANMRN